MKPTHIKNFFSSGLQAIAIQILSVLFLYIISFYLSKEEFGIISWCNAVSIMLATLLALGMEQVVFRRIAASDRSDWAAAAFLIHAVITSSALLLLLFVLSFFFDDRSLQLLPVIFLIQTFIFLSTPLKLFLNAKQRFGPYGVIAFVSNLLKIVVAILVVKGGQFGLSDAVSIMLIMAALEVVVLYVYIRKRTSFSFKVRKSAYLKLIKESRPQYISTIFDASLSRLDWILIGIIGTTAMTADYSIAYRAFEVARLPITIIAPLLLSRFAKIFVNTDKLDVSKKAVIKDIYILELFAAMLILLVLNILWTPVLDAIFDGKYGPNNATEFLLLSLNLPFLFAINLLWTISFTGKVYKKVARVTIISAVLNLVLNVTLIPIFGGKGAAAAFLLTTITQYVFYQVLVGKSFMRLPVFSILIFFVFAAGGYIVSSMLNAPLAVKSIVAIGLYLGSCLLTKQVGKSHFKTVQLLLKR